MGSNKVAISREVGENELIERVHSYTDKWVRFSHYEGNQFFALCDDKEHHALKIMELTQTGVTSVEGQTLKENYTDVVHSAQRKTCCLLGPGLIIISRTQLDQYVY